MQLLGRRRTIMLSAPLWVLGWILIALSQSYEMMLCARVLTGFCVGLVTPSAAVYVSCNFLLLILYKFVFITATTQTDLMRIIATKTF
jgi:MFS family permease